MVNYVRAPGNSLSLNSPVTDQLTGATVAIDDADAYSDGTATYDKNEIAKLGANYVRCKVTHAPTQSPGTDLAVTAGALVGDDKDNWEIVRSAGAIFAATAMDYSEETEQESTQYLDDSGPTVSTSSRSLTVNATFIKDRENQWHQALKSGFEVGFAFMPDGPVVGGQIFIGRAVCTVSQTLGDNRRNEFTLALNSTGNVVQRVAVAADLIGWTTA